MNPACNLIGAHSWSNWSKFEQTTSVRVGFGSTVEIEEGQERVCTRCGRIQRKGYR